MSKDNPAREEILAKVRSALKSCPASPASPLPDSARFADRTADVPEKEIDLFLNEIARLSGNTRKIKGSDEFASALEELVKAEGIKTAALTDNPLYRRYCVFDLLARFGVNNIPLNGDQRRLADCDLGITVADAGLPETGTSLLRTTQGEPDFLSLLTRVHLVLLTPEALLADMHQAFVLAKGDRHFVLVSGCSRTADIEKVLTLGVHGPKSFHVWVCS